MSLLKALQTNAINQNKGPIKAVLTWDAVNNALAANKSPTLGLNDQDAFTAFSTRWETDPALKSIVDKFDQRGLVIKTTNDSEMPGEPQGAGQISAMAKRATNKNRKFD